MNGVRMSNAVVGAWSVVIAVLVLLSGVVRGAQVFGSAGTGTTSITSTTCSADVSGTIPSVLNVDNNGADSVLLYFNVSWSDTRNSGPSATHYFNMTVSYSRASGDQWAATTVVTSGTQSGSQNHLITVVNVLPPSTIGLSWLAQLTSSACSPNPTSDYASGTITLV